MHEQIDNKTLQGADEPLKVLGVAWCYGGYVVLAIALHWYILRPLIGVYGLLTAFVTYFALLLLSVSREEPRLRNLWGYARRAATWRRERTRAGGRWVWNGATAPTSTIDDEVIPTTTHRSTDPDRAPTAGGKVARANAEARAKANESQRESAEARRRRS